MPKKIVFNWEKLEGMVLFDASLPTCALELGVSPDTIENYIKKKYKKTFKEYKQVYLGKTVLRLKQKMIKLALDGNVTSLIFTLKNLSDWKDNPEKEVDLNNKEILLKYNLEVSNVERS